MTGVWRLRAAVLTLVGALAVHHGRYAFAPPRHEHELAGVHEYLAWLSPAAAVLLFLALVHLLARAASGAGDRALPRTRTLWLAGTATLLAVFSAQEIVEWSFAHGHLPHPLLLLGDGGWTAVPFAVAAGCGIALLLRGAERAVGWVLARARRRARRSASPSLRMPVATDLAAPRSILGRRLAGRGPPALS